MYCGNEHDNRLLSVRKDRLDSLYLPVDQNRANYLHINADHYFFRNHETVYLFEAFNDTIYSSIRGGSMTPSFFIDYKGKNIPASFFEENYANIMEFFQAYHSTSYAYGVFNFVALDNFLMFGSYHMDNMKLTVFDRKDEVSYTFSDIKDDVYFDGLTIPVSDFIYHADKQIFVSIDAYKVIEWKNEHPLKDPFNERVNVIKEDDNPVLLIFDFKR